MDLNTITEIARPRQRAELPAWNAGDAWLAGGTWLFSEPQLKVTRLIDIADLGWLPLEPNEQGLRIAATCKIAELHGMAFPANWIAAPLVNQCCRSFLASFKIWNAATVGGNLCMALPAGPMISLTAALDGVCVIWTPEGNERRVPVTDFVLAPQRNALQSGELLRAIDLPLAALRRRTGFRQIALSSARPFRRTPDRNAVTGRWGIFADRDGGHPASGPFIVFKSAIARGVARRA